MSNKTQACPANPYCLGMCSWTACPGNADSADFADSEPHPEQPIPAIPTPTQHAAESKRFASFIENDELTALSKGMTPAWKH